MMLVGAMILSALAGPCAAAGDSENVLDILQHEFVSVEDILDRYIFLENAFAQTSDAREIFVAMLRLVTEEAASALDEGYFEDPGWTVAFLLSFNDLYRQALLDYESGRRGAVPEAWRVAFDAAKDDGTTAFTHALLGIHAHVNHDLPLAVASVVPLDERDARYPQFVDTNAFLLSTIDIIEDLVAEFDPFLAKLDEALGRLDERLLERTLTRWRFNAWRVGALLAPADGSWRARLQAAVLEYRTGQQARVIAGR